MLILGLAGCGGPDFSGRYQGDLAAAYACENGFTRNKTYGVLWPIEPAGDGRWTIGGEDDEVCPTVTLNEGPEEDVALVEPASCPPAANLNYNIDPSVQGGEITLQESGIDVRIRYRYRLSPTELGRSTGRSSTSCDDDYTGTLTKLAE